MRKGIENGFYAAGQAKVKINTLWKCGNKVKLLLGAKNCLEFILIKYKIDKILYSYNRNAHGCIVDCDCRSIISIKFHEHQKRVFFSGSPVKERENAESSVYSNIISWRI
ncbi:MAG: hypothetical protein H8D87_22370 [Deltaproteobacteria bacterium]|uniref:hypothetical protein n=1 Tax=Desulfobacula sp. TaxID=2593537 RepID=UPI0019A0D84A|nr:hypothetical protein [Candidatus Desulfobacula maris]MBL6996043.1 hypothetical protein [Desulfobacula sp.]